MLSLIVNIILVSKPYAFKNSIVGTYEIGDGKSAHYAVFTENGNYFFYEQNKTIKKGTFKKETDSSYSLYGKASVTYAILLKKYIYIVYENGKVLRYTKSSSTPTYINTTNM